MSKTKHKNAAAVWRAFLSCVHVSDKRYTLATAGEVAAVCELSVTTVRKYLRMACGEGAAHSVVLSGSGELFGYGE